MANTDVTAGNTVKLKMNVASADAEGTSVASGDTAVLSPVAGQTAFTNAQSKGASFDGGNMVLVLKNGAGATTVTFKAGVTGGTPANRAVYGDLAVSLASNDVKYLQLELSRFQDADGKVHAEVSGQAVVFTVVQLDNAA